MTTFTQWHESNDLIDFPDYETSLAKRIAQNEEANSGYLGLWTTINLSGKHHGQMFGEHLYRLDVEVDPRRVRVAALVELQTRFKGQNDPAFHRAYRDTLMKMGTQLMGVVGADFKTTEAIILDYSIIKTFYKVERQV